MNQFMNQLLDKLGVLEREAAAEKGPFRFFALFLREDSPDRWDLLVSAPWLEVDQANGMDYLAKQIQARLDTQELVILSRLVFIGEHTPGLPEILRAVNVQHGRMELASGSYLGLEIKVAYVFTADDAQTAVWPASQDLMRAI